MFGESEPDINSNYLEMLKERQYNTFAKNEREHAIARKEEF